MTEQPTPAETDSTVPDLELADLEDIRGGDGSAGHSSTSGGGSLTVDVHRVEFKP